MTMLTIIRSFASFQIIGIISILLFIELPPAHGSGEKPKGLPTDHFAIRKLDEHAPCRFVSEYRRIRSNKTDPRIAYIDLSPVVHAGEATDGNFNSLCKDIAQQTEDGVVFFDRNNAFLQLIWGDEGIVNDAIAYFSGPSKSPGVILYVTRRDIDWRPYVFEYRNDKWKDVTNKYLGPFRLNKSDYIVVPQYGRTARVLTHDGMRFHHKLWLTWDGTKFVASTAKKVPGWRCPDSYRYFDPSERRQYCR